MTDPEAVEENASAPEAAENAEGSGAEATADVQKTDKGRKKKEKKKKAAYNPDDPNEPFFKNPKNRFRLIVFLVATVVAIVAITIGVYQMTNKEPGYYEIELTLDDSVPYYSVGVAFEHYFGGSSGEIKANMQACTVVYTEVMKHSFKLLDSKNQYADTVNIASINASIGRKIKVSDELIAILSDALERSETIDGYNIFAGLYYDYWDSLVYNSYPLEEDPLYSADQAELLDRITGFLADPDTFSLTLDKTDNTVLFSVSDEFMAFYDDYGFDCPLLDLNLLHDAYRFEMVKNRLEAEGWTNGRIYTEDGLNIALSGDVGVGLLFYALKYTDKWPEAARAALIAGGSGVSSMMFRVFSFYEELTPDPGFYAFGNDPDNIVYRHKYMLCPADPGYVMSSIAVGKGSLPDLFCMNIRFFACGNATDLADTIKSAEGMTVAASVKSKPGVVLTNSSDGLAVYASDGFTAEVYQ